MKTLIAVLLMASVGYGQAKTAPPQGPPPKHLSQKADGHFTANQDPANPEKFETYTVKAGDTLSAIAGQFLKNPKMWPQLWEQNEHIVNPHWIYPNDKILIHPVTAITEAAPPPPPEPAPVQRVTRPATPQLPAQPPAPKPADVFDLGVSKSAPEIKKSDLYCSGFVRIAPVSKAMKVTAKYNSSDGALATEGDYIFVSLGSEDGIKPGTMYDVIRPTRKVQAPKGSARRDRNLGTHYLNVGQVQVITTQANFSMAKVVNSCEAVEIGDVMTPFQQLSVPALPAPRPFNPFMKTSGDMKGEVAMTKDTLLNFGSVFRASGKIPGTSSGSLAPIKNGTATEGSIVYLDLGQDSGVKPGDVFVVYRPLDLNSSLYDLPKESKDLAQEKTAVGEVVVLKVEDRSATALVTYSVDAVLTGDSVERR